MSLGVAWIDVSSNLLSCLQDEEDDDDNDDDGNDDYDDGNVVWGKKVTMIFV